MISELRRGPEWRREGEEPDYRFSLANERTFLAWVRTALALLAGAVAVVQLRPALEPHWLRVTLGSLLALLGLAISVASYGRWSAAERAMREGAPLPHTPLLIVIESGATAIALGVVAVTLTAS